MLLTLKARHVEGTQNDLGAHAPSSTAQHASAAALRLHPVRWLPGSSNGAGVFSLSALWDDLAFLPRAVASNQASILSETMLQDMPRSCTMAVRGISIERSWTRDGLGV